MISCHRRDALKLTAATLLGTALPRWTTAQSPPATVAPKSVAGVITIYREKSHADVLLGKILEGWQQDGGPGPALKLASLYVDQFPDDDLARSLCQKYQVPLFDTIAGAVTVGTDGIPVDGVISIGEHGDYPFNDLEQHLYPRRRFFQEITDTFVKHGRVVPVFNDKHLGPQWEDGKWMYDRAKELGVPFMAGSSLPVGYRTREFDVPMGCDIEAIVGIGYSGWDVYGAHAFDCTQCLAERRRGGEHGVKWVQTLQGEAMWQAVDDGLVDLATLQAAYATAPKANDRGMRADDGAALFLYEYTDGLRGAQFMFPSVRLTTVAVKLKGQSQPLATCFEEREEPSYPHFAYLLKGIEQMMHTGRPTYPVERTLLTSGLLDRALRSHAKQGQRIETPELQIAYKPVDYPHAPKPNLLAPPR
ncbi:hypothetical protein GC163_00185 [bacterium]|nr:hypothetical protein [bacterium]